MAKSELKVNEQVQKLNQQQQAIYRKVCRLAPAGARICGHHRRQDVNVAEYLVGGEQCRGLSRRFGSRFNN